MTPRLPRKKIANYFSSFLRLSIPTRDLDTKETLPEIQVFPAA